MVSRSNSFSLVCNTLKIASAIWLASCSPLYSLGYALVDWGNSDEATRNQIYAAMDEAVATFNQYSSIDVGIGVRYWDSVPTAEANYPDYLKFGNPGYINARVAMHEICHVLGSGTTWQWNANFTNGIWTGAAGSHFMKLFDGRFADIHESGVHYWPYGLNYDNEDGARERIRLVKLVSAMRADMALDGGGDWDGDGLPNEWEMFRFGNLSQTGAGDTDGDGISNHDEWWTESDPTRACPVRDGHTYIIRSKLSQKVMEAADGSAGANIRQNPLNGSSLQKWTARYVGEGYWMFLNQASGHALEVGGFSTDAGGNINTWTDLSLENQKWRIVEDGAVYSKMFNMFSMNMVIDVEGGPNATGDGINISQYFDDLGANNQAWAFDDVTPGVQTGGLVAEYKLDGGGRDNSGHSFHGVTAGGISYPVGRVDGQAAAFNGTNGTIRIPATVDRNFSIACWVKTSATASAGQWYNGMGLVDGEVPGVAADFGLAMVGGNAAFGVGNTDITITSTVAINDNVWHHLVATLDTGSGAMKLYVDGVLRQSGVGPTGARTAPANLFLGSISGITGFFNGSLDEVRLYDKLLSATEISRLANVGNTLVADYAFDGDERDSSNHGNHGRSINVTYGPGKIGSAAAQFNGSGSSINIPASVLGDFTVACWMKTTATGGTGQWYLGQAIVDAEVAGAADDWGIALLGNKAGFGVGNADKTILSTTPVNDGIWHHVVATRKNSTGAMKLYVDGSLQASDTGPMAQRTAPGGIRLGSSLNGSAFYAGAIDDLKIFNYTLGAVEVAALASSAPEPWASEDVGNPGSDGYAGYSPVGGENLTVTGGGTDIGGTSDQFQFLHSIADGDLTAVTRMDATQVGLNGPAATDSKAGLMFRNSTASNSAFVDLVYNHSTGIRFMYRDATGAVVGSVGSAVPVTTPFWLKLERFGNTFAASYATTSGFPDFGDWISMGTHDTVLVAAPLAGLAVTSHNGAEVATATFSQLAVSTPAGLWRNVHFGSTANEGDAANDSDPDHDDLVNLIERAFGLDPNVPNGPDDRPSMDRDETYLSLSYDRNLDAADLQIQALWSNELLTWSVAGVTDEVVSSNSATERHVAKVPLSNLDPDHAFLHLKVSE